MKNLSKEDKKFLEELSKKMNAQSNRATQFPMFVVKQKVKVYGDSSWCNGTERIEDYDPDWLCDDCRKIAEEGGELPDHCLSCEDECFESFYWEDKTVENCGSFFTAEAAQAHIDQNDYHYNEPFVYGIGSWRNYELQRVLEIFSKIENGEAKNYYR